jgi:hypothetical protein
MVPTAAMDWPLPLRKNASASWCAASLSAVICRLVRSTSLDARARRPFATLAISAWSNFAEAACLYAASAASALSPTQDPPLNTPSA